MSRGAGILAGRRRPDFPFACLLGGRRGGGARGGTPVSSFPLSLSTGPACDFCLTPFRFTHQPSTHQQTTPQAASVSESARTHRSEKAAAASKAASPKPPPSSHKRTNHPTNQTMMLAAPRRFVLIAVLLAATALCALGFVPQFVPRHTALSTTTARGGGLPSSTPRAARMRCVPSCIVMAGASVVCGWVDVDGAAAAAAWICACARWEHQMFHDARHTHTDHPRPRLALSN